MLWPIEKRNPVLKVVGSVWMRESLNTHINKLFLSTHTNVIMAKSAYYMIYIVTRVKLAGLEWNNLAMGTKHFVHRVLQEECVIKCIPWFTVKSCSWPPHQIVFIIWYHEIRNETSSQSPSQLPKSRCIKVSLYTLSTTKSLLLLIELKWDIKVIWHIKLL